MNRMAITGMLSLCLTLTTPVATRANNIEETVTAAQFENALPYVTDFNLKYSSNGVNIREEPNAHSKIIGHTLLNTTFKVVLDIGGWSMITTEDGYAYIKSEFLSDEEIKYTEEDLKILAMILCGECQSYPDEEQLRVGSVFLNRVKSNKYPNTFIGVAKDKKFGKQYASWWDGNAHREIQESNWRNAKWLLENGSILPDKVIGQSQGIPKGRKLYYKSEWHAFWY